MFTPAGDNNMSQQQPDESFFNRKFQELEQSNEKRNSELTAQINGFTKGLRIMEKRQAFLEEENENLKYEIQRLRRDVDSLLGRNTAANLIMENCAPEEDEDSEDKIRTRVLKLFKRVNVQIKPEQITAAERLGQPVTGKIQPILLTLSEPGLRKVVFSASKEFRSRFGIYVNKDYTRAQREELYHVRVTKRLLLQNNINCYQREFYIYIGDKPFNWKAAERLLQRELTRKSLPKDTEEEYYQSDSSVASVASNNSKRKLVKSPAGNNSKKPLKKQRNTLNSQGLRPSPLSQVAPLPKGRQLPKHTNPSNSQGQVMQVNDDASATESI